MTETQREHAIAGLDAYIDVLCSWRGRYEDDDLRADAEWITDVIGTNPPLEGWEAVLGYVPETGGVLGANRHHAIGWVINQRGQWQFGSLPAKPSRRVFDLTRREFRQLARDCGVSLPSRHATLHLHKRGAE